MDVDVRPALASDLSFMTEMTATAAFWKDDAPSTRVDELMESPDLAHYIAGWPLPGDVGVIAEADQPVGAAWFRFFTADDPGYGFVDPTIPEVAIGVRSAWRGQGVGRRLLAALITAASEAGVAALSLSVEVDNGARLLYEQLGFTRVGEAEGEITMLLRLET